MLFRSKNLIIPIEVKSGAKGTLKSLHEFVDLAPHNFAVRVYSGKYAVEESKTRNGKVFRLLNLPFYQLCKIEKHISKYI